MPSAASTAVSMDVEKLYRCQQFFLEHLLRDRRCTFDVLEYQTTKEKFVQYYHAVSKEKPSSLADRFQIVGTMPVRRAAYRFASTRTNGGQPERAAHVPVGEPGLPPVPPHAWAPAFKKAAEAAERVVADRAANATGPPPPGAAPTSSSSTPGTAAPVRSAKNDAGGGKKTTGSGSRKATGTGEACETAVVQQPLKWVRGVAQVPFVVHFLPNAGDASFGKPAAAQLVALMRARGIRWLFLVTVGGITPYAARELATWCCFEVWPLMACLCPAVQHQAFPPHRLLGPGEKAAFFAKWKVTPAQVPRMHVTDPAAKYYGYVPGDLVAVRRNTDVGFLEAFRTVVHVPV